MSLIVFEDELWQRFATLVQARPVFELRIGGYTVRERIEATVRSLRRDETLALGMARPHLMKCFGPSAGLTAFLQAGEPVILVNGRALDLAWLPRLLAEPLNTVYLAGDTLLAAYLSPALASAVLYFVQSQHTSDARDELLRFARAHDLGPDEPPLLLGFPWDLINQSGEQLVRDLPLLEQRLPLLTTALPNVVVRGERVYVDPRARLDGPLVLDARDGPIFIEAEAHIEPFSFLQGPAYIGRGSLISSARIRGETAIGPVCRVGGEVEASIIQGYSNKHHDGFLGHSWLGEWVNIGAMTTNSDLKNNYGNIRVNLEDLGQFDSGVIKLGMFLADHVKLGIGLLLNGGTMIGTGSNVFGSQNIPKNIPHFTWGGDTLREYRIDGMIGVTRTVMGRRKRVLTSDYEALLRAAFELTRASRGAVAQAPVSRRDYASPRALAQAEQEAIAG
ncbi:putative sugar nucleotidyl transferase [Candidatus Chloroploca sp. Khr17]|uniref:putative sugar nucleotidyl transferase n=1 Tax=Candidatus Chloroploca sp. Khr17 TaxID=2496869 RepID=UPI00101DDBA6|nr:putative sugar nucleotidyl transferase [Candidatus Chloroploca sp. Khr17]